MLVNSRSMKGKCPVCGAGNCSCGGPSKVVPVDERVTMASRGPLKQYDLGRGVSIQLTDEAARALGLSLPEPPKDKMRRVGLNKGVRSG